MASSAQPRAGSSSSSAQRRDSMGKFEQDITLRFGALDLDEIHDPFESQNQRGVRVTDAELALRMQVEEVRNLQSFNTDLAVARSMFEDDFVFDSGPDDELIGVLHEDPVMHRQRQVADAPRQEAQGNGRTTQAQDGVLDSWLSAIVGTVYSWFTAPSIAQPPASPVTISAPTRSVHGTGQNCVACQDRIRGPLVHAPCGHDYDKSCILDLFEAATRDESLFPPRCCRQNIPLSSVQHLMSVSLASLFATKSLEFSTLKRVYCANPTCSQFLGAQLQKTFWEARPRKYVCTAKDCRTLTCAFCKTRVVPNVPHHCQIDESEQIVLALGNREGWARCPGCEQLIELHLGCYHMTCKCKTEFCYICRARWKTCGCVQWEERRLIAAAEARVDAQIAARANDNRRAFVEPVRAIGAAATNAHLREQPAVVRAPTDMFRGQPTTTATALPPRPPVRPAISGSTLPAWRTAPSRPQSTAQTDSLHDQPTTVTIPALPLAQPDINDPFFGSIQSPPPPPYVPAVHPPAYMLRSPASSQQSRSTNITPRAADSKPNDKGKGVNRNSAYTMKSSTETERQRLVRVAMEELRVNHDCQHTKWKWRRGGGPCQTCHQHLPHYLFRCLDCHILACNRCRRNRL